MLGRAALTPAVGDPCVSAISRALPAWRLGSRSHFSQAEEPHAAGTMLCVTRDLPARPGWSLLPPAGHQLTTWQK